MGISLNLILGLIGYQLAANRVLHNEQVAQTVLNDVDGVLATVGAPPENKPRSTKVVLKISALIRKQKEYPINGTCLIYLEKSKRAATLEIGDLILVTSKFSKVQKPQNPHEFDYRQYLAFHDIYVQAYVSNNHWKILAKNSRFSLLNIAHQFRCYLLSIFNLYGLEKNELAIASALVLGQKSGLNDDIKHAYSSSGAMHVLAVSGLHVGFIYLLLFQVFKFLHHWPYGQWIRLCVVLLSLWTYALITGLSPSVLRACTMFSFIAFAQSIKRHPNLFNTLSASAFLLLIVNPFILMEVGFQLSYCAVLGIVIIQPWLSKWFYSRYWLLQKIWEISTVSIAAQLGTFPLGLLYFHQFPNYFLFSNLFVIPLATIILFSGIGLLISHKIPYLSEAFAFILNQLIALLNKLVFWVESLPFALSKGIRFTILDTWLTYCIIVSLILLVIQRKFKYFASATGISALLLLCNIWQQAKHHRQEKLIVYSTSKNTLFEFVQGNHSFFYCNDPSFLNSSNYQFHTDNYRIYNQIKQSRIIHDKTTGLVSSHFPLYKQANFYQFNTLRLVYLDHSYDSIQSSDQLKVDIALYGKHCQLSLKQLLTIFNIKILVLGNSLSTFKRNQLKTEAKKLGLNCHDLKSQGAFEITL